MSEDFLTPDNLYPKDKEEKKQVTKRHRWGRVWRSLFFIATAAAIVILAILLTNIINQSFGLAATKNEIPPEILVQDYQIERMLSAANVESSEDDQALAQSIGSDPNATGFFGYAFYENNTEILNALSVNGVAPSAETANSGEYPLTRPLYLYTTADILEEQPQVAAFIDYYLSNLDSTLDTVGYFPADEESRTASVELLAEALGVTQLPEIDPADYAGNVVAAGSSTVFPITQLIGEEFKADGFTGTVDVSSVGTSGGFDLFCVEALSNISIVNASRPINPVELDACKANGRELIEIRIGTDALTVVVNESNDFVTDVDEAQLRQMFTTAVNWSDINPDWPEAAIARFIPGQSSGTLDFFIESVFIDKLKDLPKEALVDILENNISIGLGRRLERDQLFFDDRTVFEDPVLFNELCADENPPEACLLPARTQEEVYQLVLDRVVVPTVVESWYLFDSLLNREEIILEAKEKYPDAEVEFYRWLTTDFVTNPQSSKPELAGVRTAILGTLWVILITVLFSFPIGVGAAIYLEEYADQSKRINRLIQTNINNLAGVPSIIYGMLGLAIFVRALEPITSGAIFGLVDDTTTANGRTILSAGLTLGLLILPIIIISAQEAIRAVPRSLRQASYGLGATRWQTIWHHVLPAAFPGIMTGTILSMSRAIGETAPLVVVGASTFITVDPTSPFSKFTVLPIQIFQWTTRPQGAFRNIAGAAIIVLLILLLALNATAVFLRNRASKKRR
ncbi:MAG: phosphate ABC transporter permease PstA [Candidatus Promineifilaceae bacterium]